MNKWNMLLMAALMVGIQANGNAARRAKAEVKLVNTAGEDQRMRKALEADGWTVLEMETDLYKPGQLLRVGSTVPEASGCVDATALSGSFKTTASEGSAGFVIAGSGQLGNVGAEASVQAKTFQLKNISDTTTEVIETIDFELNERCTKYLQKLQDRSVDLAGWVVIQQTLSARVKEVTCTGQEAAAKVQALWVARAELGEMRGCTQSSDVTGVIAYKTRPVSELWAAAAPAVVAAPPVPPVAGDNSWAKSLLDWDACDFGYLNQVFQDREVRFAQEPRQREFILSFAQKVASSSTARRYLAEYGGSAVKSCDRDEWTRACKEMRERIADYKAVRDRLWCSRTCEPLETYNWGRGESTRDDSKSYPEDCDTQGCQYDYYREVIEAYEKSQYGSPDWYRTNQIQFIHRQTLRGIGTMEMNKLINTFCQ